MKAISDVSVVSEGTSDNSPVVRTIKVPDPKNANNVLFPFAKRAGGDDDNTKAKSFALLGAWREYLCNFHSFRRFKTRAENKAVIGTMEIGDDVYVFGFHNGKPFHDRKAITQKGLVTNESDGEGGYSLQGAGLKLPAQYLTIPGTQQLVVASKCGDGGSLVVGTATNNNNLFDINICSDDETDKKWEMILKQKCGDSLYEQFTVFYLAKINPFFNVKNKDCAMGTLWPYLPYMVGDILNDITVHVVETCMAEGDIMAIKMKQPNFGFEIFSKQEMLEMYCCKDDAGEASVEDSVFVSERKDIPYVGNGFKCDIGGRVKIYPMAGMYSDTCIEQIKKLESHNNNYSATLRDGGRSDKGSGSRPGKWTPIRGNLKISAVYKFKDEENCFKRFEDQPIAIVKKGEAAMLYSALGLPVTSEFVPTEIAVDGQKKVIRNPWVMIEVDIETMSNYVDTSTGFTSSDPVLLALQLGLRGDFLIPHADPKYKDMRDELMVAVCQAVAEDITPDHWLYKWCTDRFAPVEHKLYDRNYNFSEAGDTKEKRKIVKYDIENFAHDFKLNLTSDAQKFVALKLADTGEFITSDVDTATHSSGCNIEKLPMPFADYLEEWTTEQNEKSAHLSSELKNVVRKANNDRKIALLKSYELFVKRENDGKEVQVYKVTTDKIGYRDEKGILHPFADMMDRS